MAVAAVVFLAALPLSAALETPPLSKGSRGEDQQKPAVSGQASRSGLNRVYDYFTTTWLKKLKHPGAKISLAYVLSRKH
ncbi:MAG TPA: hypothetical protein VJ936_02875, partial [Desulfobacteraceae bacterium]|nr:hypothetical protein [Desulfobacteraceae bacterium]